MLPDRIELSTSPLPMECSTTELRQHVLVKNRAPEGPTKRADICHKPPCCASLLAPSERENRADIEAKSTVLARNGRLSIDSAPCSPTHLVSCLKARAGAISNFARSGHAGLLSCRIPWACYRRCH